MMRTVLPILIAATVALPAWAMASGPKDAIATASLRDGQGAVQGEARLVQTRGKVELRITARGLTPGAHGAHLHMVGTCTAPDFTSAGSHLNPHGKMHGAKNPQGSHLGDLPNIVAGTNGTGTLTVALNGSMAELEPQLFDADGTALVIHATADDYMTDPTGSSGGRVLCGALTRS
jgi:Cu-Zn family superoxide dismutase